MTVPAVPEPNVPEVLPDKATAVAFTKQLKAKLDHLEEGALDAIADIAHTRESRLWKSMDYPTWDAYAEAELGMGKRHANRLIRHAIFAGELGPVGPTLSERQTRDVPAKRRKAVAEKVKTETEDLPPEDATAKADAILAKEAERAAKAKDAKKAKANYESHELKNTLADPEWSGLLALARKHSIDRDALSSRLHRAAVNLAMLADAAGVADPVAFLETDLAAFVESGEVPPSPAYVAALTKANGQQRTRMRAPALEAAMTKQAGSVATKTKTDHVHKAESRGASGVAKCKCGASKVGDKWVEP